MRLSSEQRYRSSRMLTRAHRATIAEANRAVAEGLALGLKEAKKKAAKEKAA